MRFKKKSLVQVVTFALITGALVALVGLTFSKVRIEDHRVYSAELADASGLAVRSDVRASGVTIGSVKAIGLTDQGVEVEFTVNRDVELDTATRARIRYSNLVGDRYLELTPGTEQERAQATTLAAGGRIPIERTQPALDLDELFAGFGPLTQALAPEEINQLAENVLGITEGRAPEIRAMMSDVASFTSGLADYDELIGATIDELGTTLATMNEEDALDELITTMTSLAEHLDRDRDEVVGSLGELSLAADDVTSFLTAVRPGFQANVRQIGEVAANLNTRSAYLQDVFSKYPRTAQNLGRGAVKGSYFDFFLCGIRVKIDVPGEGDIETPALTTDARRCQHEKEN